MIDEKKIEEAIKEASSKMYNLPSGSPAISNHFADGFLEGIKWFLGNLWHDASEEPDRGQHILLEYDNEHLSSDAYSPYGQEWLHPNLSEKYWSLLVKTEHITRWLYIDDLTKGGK